MDPKKTAIEGTEFTIFSGILKASRAADGRMRLHGIASSTTKDLHGDTMSPSAIEDMETAANNNLTIFLNHSYEVPEDVAGSVEAARMKTRGVSDLGDPNHDLDMDILINDANPRAVQAFEAIERGTKLGLSIGALIPEGGARKEKGGAYVIDHIQLLETSLVGIPANPRSWIEYAVKSLRAKEVPETPVPVVVVDAAPELIVEPVEPAVVDSTISTTTTTVIDTDVDAPVSDATPIDASAPQDGLASNPDTGVEDDAGTEADLVIAKLDMTFDHPVVAQVVDLLRTTTSELVAAKGQVTELTAAKAAITTERDTAVAQRDMVLLETKRVLDNLANTPLMRRAVVVDAEKELRTKFSGIYSEDFLKMLESPNDRAR